MAEIIMSDMWGEKAVHAQPVPPTKGSHFQDGNFGMFIHWGLFSHLANKWRGKTYYGVGEWLMFEEMANIPVEEYKKVARDFNPTKFDAAAIVQLAKDAGMKYVVLTSKHHDGFAMFKSANPFNIVDAGSFQRDPLKELSDACREAGLGFGAYYSHFQDWTAPGGNRGPRHNPDGSEATFKDYFREKCYPQVEEVCTAYGPLEVVWFDTPGPMEKEDVTALHDLVRKTQPGALLGSRIGYGLGDYSTQGDMEVPAERIDGLWETCDTTNDAWGFAWYDTNWKDSKQILERLIATVARGGTYLLNVGPDGTGVIPEQCQMFLRKAGAWISQNPEAIYGAGPSPWKFAMPWGDITTQNDNTLYLSVFSWPQDGRLHLPGLKTKIVSADLLQKDGSVSISHHQSDEWAQLSLPARPTDEIIPVIRIKLQEKAVVSFELGLHPNLPNTLLCHAAKVQGAEKSDSQWMEKFGEWKKVTQISKWTDTGTAKWEVDVLEEGLYHLDVTYRGGSPVVWRVETDEKIGIQNQQPATSQFGRYPIGIIQFKKRGGLTLTVSMLSGASDTCLASLHLTPVS